jgi:hypothetical protein
MHPPIMKPASHSSAPDADLAIVGVIQQSRLPRIAPGHRRTAVVEVGLNSDYVTARGIRAFNKNGKDHR